MFGHVQIACKQDDETGSSGAEDPMLEARVAALEADVGTIRSILERIGPRIEEILLTGAKRADLDSYRAEARFETGALRGDLRESSAQLRGDLRETREQLRAELLQSHADLKSDSRETAARVSALPSVWTILGIVFTTWALGSGLLIFSLTRILAK